MSTMTAGELAKVLEQLDALGLTDAAPDARRFLAQAQELTQRATHAPGDLKATKARVARALADGAIDIDDAVNQTTAVVTELARAEAAVDLYRRARTIAEGRAHQAFIDLGDGLLTDISTITNPALLAARKAADKLPPDIVDDTTAVDAGDAALKAWTVLTDSFRTWTTATRLVRYLREREALPLSKHAARHDWHLYLMHHPERAVKLRPGIRPHEVYLFALDLKAGVEFDLLTAAQLDARLAEQQAVHDAEVERIRLDARKRQSVNRIGVAGEVGREVMAEEAAREALEPAIDGAA